MPPSTNGNRRPETPREIAMVKQILFMISAGILAVVICRSVYAAPFTDIALPEMVDDAVASRDLPTDR
jgi:hypothetical protein